MLDVEVIRQRIEREYVLRGDSLGWRLLYSPWQTIETADIAFIGLNPGGSKEEADHSQLSSEAGSSYLLERWGSALPGEAPLQRQFRALCEKLNVPCEQVLSGNLIPFRSKSFRDLSHPKQAKCFGLEIWNDILSQSHVHTIIAMGRDAQIAMFEHFGLLNCVETRNAGWGRQKVRKAFNKDITVIGLPHLSRFAIMKRPQSASAINWAFGK